MKAKIRPVAVAMAALTAAALSAPAIGAATPRTSHASRVTFGALLTKHSQPSNAYQGIACHDVTGKTGPCTRVMVAAYRRNDDAPAPETGTLKAIKLIAGVPGSFRLEIAAAKPQSHQARIVAKGPKITYKGNGPTDPGDNYTIETFKVNMPIKKGQYLAIQGNKESLMYCSGGGLNQLVYSPPLKPSTSFTTTKNIDGCLLLLEGVETT